MARGSLPIDNGNAIERGENFFQNAIFYCPEKFNSFETTIRLSHRQATRLLGFSTR
ncbi:hypothetical protein SAMN04488028_103185 [Reichenbachiella agariperforans]|uniref:Uncharacterized protein n=1 Tax=Reichenbachiella agariperforans TaxID=156994 RepID=A0A1M6Q6E3_REIAG|nr:hypothetical protein SAMN04488028_103185 [Reichenbachiella agariperforans]